MSANDTFHAETNPFRALEAKRFPSNEKDGKVNVVKRRKDAKKFGGARSGISLHAEPDADSRNDDAELFLDAVGQVRSIKSRGREVAVRPKAGDDQTRPADPETSDLQKFIEGKIEFALSLTDEYLEGHVVGIEEVLLNKLRAGAFSPEAHLDLHGLNAAQAFETLRSFMRGCWYKGMRTVLVVPGRGRNSPDGMGVLREKLPNWLTQDPFKRVILAFCTAQSHDGGLGGVYVLLRKYRKKGRVCWEKMPADADLY